MSIVPLVLFVLVQNAAGPESTGTASIQGLVVRTGSGDPLSKAIVELRPDVPTTQPLRVVTEGDGRFGFPRIQPGRYQIVVSRSGYVRSPMTMTLAAGQRTTGLRLPMTPSTAIFGRVYDDKGAPLGGVEVRALRAGYQEGRRKLTVVRSVDTNDLGEYRLFWLPPGRYFVAAVPSDSVFRGGGMFSGRAGANGTYLVRGTADPERAAFLPLHDPADQSGSIPMYFPGTADEQAASGIDLRAGADFGGVDIVVAPARARRVRGTIIDGATGRPAQSGGLRRYVDPAVPNPGGARPFEDVEPGTGAFELELPPGAHTLVGTSSSGIGYAVVQVGDADIDGVSIVTAPTFSLKAHIGVEGPSGTGIDLAALRVSLRRDPAIPGTTSASYSVPLPNGTFSLEAAPGNFRANVAPILNLVAMPPFLSLPRALENAYVKSIRLGDADVLDGGLRLEKAPDALLEIVIGTKPGVVEGRVVTERDVIADLSVVLVPGVGQRFDLFRSAPADASGRFRFDRVPPGAYKIYAWADVEDGAWFDADFIGRFENRGVPIEVREGAVQSIQVTAITP